MLKRYFIGSAAHISPQTEPTEKHPKANDNFATNNILSSKRGLSLKQCNSTFLTFAYFAKVDNDT